MVFYFSGWSSLFLFNFSFASLLCRHHHHLLRLHLTDVAVTACSSHSADIRSFLAVVVVNMVLSRFVITTPPIFSAVRPCGECCRAG